MTGPLKVPKSIFDGNNYMYLLVFGLESNNFDPPLRKSILNQNYLSQTRFKYNCSMKPKARINLGSNTSQSFSLFVKGLSTTDLLSCFSSIRDSIHLLLSRRYKSESVQYLNFKSGIKFHIWRPITSSSQNSWLFVTSNHIFFKLHYMPKLFSPSKI